MPTRPMMTTRSGFGRSMTPAIVLTTGLSGCMASSVERVNPSSEIALAVRQEYRSFVETSRSDLGPRTVDEEGRVIPAPPSASQPLEPSRPKQVEAIPRGKSSALAYWEDQMQDPQTSSPNKVAFRVDDLLDRALTRSNQLAAFADVPLIRDTVVREAEGQFDTFAFAEAEAGTIDQPISNRLETGTSANAPSQLEEDTFGLEVGVRQPLITGGEIRLSQRFGGRNSNSEFFVPNDQADAELRLELRQPLLDGAGIAVTTAPIQLARLERDQSISELQRQIETQLIEVVRTYWTLFAERARVLQREQLVREMTRVANAVAARSSLDALPGEVEQARAALRRAEASIVRARAGVDNSEARLAAQLSDPSLFGDVTEIIPAQRPTRTFVDVPLEDISLLALENRSELRVAALQLRGAELRVDVAENRLLPDLDLIATVSNNGLDGDYAFGEAFGGQFTQSDLDATIGLRLEVPLGNISDRAIYDRRRLEVRQLTSQLRNVADTILLETQIAVREVRAAYEEMRAREAELQAQITELAALRRRAEEGIDIGTAYLTNVISAIEDRARAEEQLLDATVAYNLALYSLERVAGTMLSVRDIGVVRVSSDLLDYLTPVRGTEGLPDGDDLSVNILVEPEAIRSYRVTE
ncbi:TolC family protein [Rhodobacteraceae bacterium NNCM2]|nr:TolC family protein [Coraliihabitans acroporae]